MSVDKTLLDLEAELAAMGDRLDWLWEKALLAYDNKPTEGPIRHEEWCTLMTHHHDLMKLRLALVTTILAKETS